MSQFGLGRGLEALIPRAPMPMAPLPTAVTRGVPDGTPLSVAIGAIIINDYQPRQDFGEAELRELADSIREYGIIQPLVLTRNGNQFRLIAGERRLRAAKLAGLSEVPAVVREADEHERAVIAIIENVQRVDLNPIETAHAYQRLIDEFSLTQEEIAIKMGKSRPSVANTLRMIRLHPEVQEAMRSGLINEGHGKVLAGLTEPTEQMALLAQILESKLTVSDTSHRAHIVKGQKGPKVRPRDGKDPATASKEELLREHFGTKVSIDRRGLGGAIVIDFYSEDELKGILNKMIL